MAFLIASLWVFRRRENFSLCLLTCVRRKLVLEQSPLLGELGGVLLALCCIAMPAGLGWGRRVWMLERPLPRWLQLDGFLSSTVA